MADRKCTKNVGVYSNTIITTVRKAGTAVAFGKAFPGMQVSVTFSKVMRVDRNPGNSVTLTFFRTLSWLQSYKLARCYSLARPFRAYQFRWPLSKVKVSGQLKPWKHYYCHFLGHCNIWNFTCLDNFSQGQGQPSAKLQVQTRNAVEFIHSIPPCWSSSAVSRAVPSKMGGNKRRMKYTSFMPMTRFSNIQMIVNSIHNAASMNILSKVHLAPSATSTPTQNHACRTCTGFLHYNLQKMPWHWSG